VDGTASVGIVFNGVLHNVRATLPNISGLAGPTTEALLIGADRAAGSAWIGWIGEVVTFATQLSTPNYATLYTNQKTYWGTP
jgi:hypothetical protein